MKLFPNSYYQEREFKKQFITTYLATRATQHTSFDSGRNQGQVRAASKKADYYWEDLQAVLSTNKNVSLLATNLTTCHYIEDGLSSGCKSCGHYSIHYKLCTIHPPIPRAKELSEGKELTKK